MLQFGPFHSPKKGTVSEESPGGVFLEDSSGGHWTGPSCGQRGRVAFSQ